MVRARLLLLGWGLVLGGGWVAHRVQTAGGIEVRDVRIPVEGGSELAGLLYVPAGATEASPAPAVLAVHGYINSRETQSGFAIEFARRGMVVLALDQSGHGFSDPPAFANGFGGPPALDWLRSLPFVDPERIGLEGHSMGGWASLAAAAAHPDGYRSLVLVGSSTGSAGAPVGTTDFPRNLAVVFSLYDEFGRLMWGVENAADVTASEKLRSVFGGDSDIEPGRVYGSVEDGTARMLATPRTTHPGDHLSREAIGDAVSWMRRTLDVPTDLADDDQTWFWKELGTGAALLGGILILLGSFELLLGLRWFDPVRRSVDQTPRLAPPKRDAGRTPRWWITLLVAAVLPAITYFPLVRWGGALSPSPALPQGITNQVLVWAMVNGVLALGFAWISGMRTVTPGASWIERVTRHAAAAAASVACLYAALIVSDLAFTTDLRFWVVALKPFAPHHVAAFAAYLVPFTIFFLASHRGLTASFLLPHDGPTVHYITGVGVAAGGMAALVAGLYAGLFATGHLPVSDALFSIVAIQFVPVLAATGVISVFTWRRTGDALPGALICGLWVTWYIVAGQATHMP